MIDCIILAAIALVAGIVIGEHQIASSIIAGIRAARRRLPRRTIHIVGVLERDPRDVPAVWRRPVIDTTATEVRRG